MIDEQEAADLFLFAASLSAEQRNPAPTVINLNRMVEYATGSLKEAECEHLELHVSSHPELRYRLLEVMRVTRALATNPHAFATLTPTEDPLRFEIVHRWRQQSPTSDDRTAFSQPMVGREEDIGRLNRLLTDASSSRMITVTAPGGVGKTFLVRKLVSEHPSVVNIDCRQIQSSEDFLIALGTALGVNVESNAQQNLVSHLAGKQSLLFLDRMDDLRHLASDIEFLLAHTDLRIIATSRIPLGVAGETEYVLGPLGTADDDLKPSPAVQLFLETARKLIQDFKLTTANIALVRNLCGATMGIPLAISIAAGSLQIRSIESMSADLGTGNRGAIAYTSDAVKSAISSSFRFLTPADQRFLQHLGVFADRFAFEEAHLVCAISDQELSQHLIRLQTCGLIEASVTPESVFYVIHDTVAESLARPGEDLSSFTARHTALFAEKATRIGAAMARGNWNEGVRELQAGRSNFRKAMARAIEAKDDDAICEFANGLARIYFESGWLADFELICESGLATADRQKDSELETRLLGLAGALASRKADEDRCRKLWIRRLEISRATGDHVSATDALIDLAWQAYELGQTDQANLYLADAEALAETNREPALSATAHVIRARFELGSGNLEACEIAIEQAIAAMAKGGDPDPLLFVRQNLIFVLQALGKSAEVEPLIWDLLSDSHTGNRVIHAAWSLRRLATEFEAREDYAQAAKCYAAALKIYSEYSSRHQTVTEQSRDELSQRAPETVQGVFRKLRETPWQLIVDDLLRARIA